MAKTNKTKRIAKTTDKRNLKYGSLSVTITVIFVALVVILNIIATSLSSVHGWYTDMTASGYYSLSDAFVEEMDKLVYPETGEKVYINIVLLAKAVEICNLKHGYFLCFAARLSRISRTISRTVSFSSSFSSLYSP